MEGPKEVLIINGYIYSIREVEPCLANTGPHADRVVIVVTHLPPLLFRFKHDVSERKIQVLVQMAAS